MTVNNLIQLLQKCDLNAQVRTGTCCGTVDGIIKGIHVNIVSPSNGRHCVYLECEITHYEGERILRKNTFRKNNYHPIVKV